MAKKNKINARKGRELEKQNALKIHQVNEAKRQKEKSEEEERIRRETEEMTREEEIAEIEKKMPESKKRVKKSGLKTAGIKNIIQINEDKLLLTSFGYGAEACREMYIARNKENKLELLIEEISDESWINYKDLDLKEILKRINYDYKTDQLQLKPVLEKLFFGRAFEGNFHIQLIYNILDIDKILTFTINTIDFIFNNLLRDLADPQEDFFGRNFPEYKTLVENKNNDEKLERKRKIFYALAESNRLAYFGSELLRDNLLKDVEGCKKYKKGEEEKIDRKDDNTEKLYFRELYNVFFALGFVRNGLSHHGNEMYKIDGNKNWAEKSDQKKEMLRILDKLYRIRVEKINSSFVRMNDKTIAILRWAYSDKEADPKVLTKEYYEYVVLEKHKELGISVKKLREILSTEKYAGTKGNKDYDTVRHKLNMTMDFIIYRFYKKDYEEKKAENSENESRVMMLIEQLRGARKDSEKEYYYAEEAKLLWKEIGSKIEKHILPIMNGVDIAAISENIADEDSIEETKIGTEATYFSKLIYMLTIFLDEKEINDMLTQLINRFDNIGSLLDLMEKEKLSGKNAGEDLEAIFNKKYGLFNIRSDVETDLGYEEVNSGKLIAKELRIVNSIARMKTDRQTVVKKELLSDAVNLIGCDESQVKALAESIGMADTEIDLNTFSKKVFNIKNERIPEKSREQVYEFRSFIIKNIIASDRFNYIMRYGTPDKDRIFAKDRRIISLVVNNMPDEVIKEYYNSCTGESEPYYNDNMREFLIEMVIGLNLTDFLFVNQEKTRNPEKDAAKERKKSMIRFYLLVLYQFKKNQIYINARYFYAFNRQETDQNIYMDNRNIKLEKGTDDRRNMTLWYMDDYCNKLTVDENAGRYEEKKKNRKEKDFSIIRQNLEHSDPWAIKAYRNKIMHLSAIRNADRYIEKIGEFNSYFELYHYLMQRELAAQNQFEQKNPLYYPRLIENERPNSFTKKYFDLTDPYKEKHYIYSKDFVKALNTPFAYNHARYKNLSEKELFDRNNYRSNNAGKEKINKLNIFRKVSERPEILNPDDTEYWDTINVGVNELEDIMIDMKNETE